MTFYHNKTFDTNADGQREIIQLNIDTIVKRVSRRTKALIKVLQSAINKK